MQEAVLVEDETRHIVLTNERFLDLFNIPAKPEQLVGSDCSNAAEESKHLFTDPEGFVTRIEELLEKRELVLGDKLEMTDGTHLQRDYVPVFEEQTYLGHLWVYRDITEQERARQRLEELALTDQLTEVANRRGFGIRFSVEMERIRREGGVLSLVLADIDHFKSYNDNFGHPAGDAALKTFAQLLESTVRKTDVVGRYGGEEFIILLVGADRETAMEVVERCRVAIEEHAWDHRGITASFGVTTGSPAPDERNELGRMSDLVDQADEALYRAKESGRNTVVHAQPD